MRIVRWILSLLLVMGWAVSLVAGGFSRMQARVEAQQALDRVAYGHQVVPQGTAAPALEKAYPADASKAKVEKALLESKALALYWQRPITGEQLQAEMDRMVRGSRDSKLLKEMFAALGGDPEAIAEYLARPLLADRLCRQWYAHDERFHGDLKSRAQQELEGLAARTLRSADGQYSEYELKENTSGKPEAGPGELGALDPGQWKTVLSRLAEVLHVQSAVNTQDLPTGRVSALQEDDTRFYALAILEAAPHTVKVALVQWPKVSFDQWLNQQGGVLGVEEPASSSSTYPYHLEPVPEVASGANDTWSPMTQVPQERESCSSVWTGTEMIVWGGLVEGIPLNTGGRYNPATDTWILTSTQNAPTGRYLHSTVWTGTRMLVWGGGYSLFMTTGGLYDPATDTWAAIADSAGTVTGRTYNSTVWTGAEMIVWGGYASSGLVNSGGAYDPAANKWRALSAPTVGTKTLDARYGHACVWTGSKMIIWGGMDMAFPTPNYWADGMLCDPSTNTWTIMSPSGQAGRSWANAVWTGNQMIIWGGENAGGPLGTGLTYDPVADAWGTTSAAGAPSAREQHFAWWTGSAMVIWGGSGAGGLKFSGGRYSPGSDSWQPVSTLNAPVPRYYSMSVWTGNEMIVWGGLWGGIVGGRYNPVSDSWVSTSSYNIPAARRNYAEVWTGTEALIWGGDDTTNTPVIGPGGRYNPATDSWAVMSSVNAPIPRTQLRGIWTGTSLVVWGGVTDPGGTLTNTGGVYNAGTDTWTPTTLTSAPTAGMVGGSAIWTGSEMIVWGGVGSAIGTETNEGGRYNPVTDSWAATSTTHVLPRASHTTVWTGAEMIVWGGLDNNSYLTGTGQRYNPSTDTWTDVTTIGAPDARYVHSAVWTGNRMIIWGGAGASFPMIQLGASYDPAADVWAPISSMGAPSERYANVVVWTGHEMVVWGGVEMGTGNLLNSGGRYRPSVDAWSTMSQVGAPTPRRDIPGVFTGNALVVWSGMQLDDAPSSMGGRYWMTFGPAVTGVNPNVGSVSGGTSVTITGTAFTSATSVAFGGSPATTFSINSDTQITAVSPPGFVGTVDVVVTTPDGISAATSADQFTYTSVAVLGIQSNTFVDSCVVGGSGSGDGYIDPGEDIALTVTLSNTGTSGATNVQAVLTSTTPGVFISGATTSFPDIPFGGTGTTVSPYVFHVEASHACGDTLAFTLQVTANEGSWTANLILPVGHYGTPPTIGMFAENFDASGGVLPGGWATETIAGNTWVVGSGGYICSASYALQYVSSTTVAADSWVYTPAQNLTAGVTYTLSFTERVGLSKAHILSILLGNTQSHLGMTTQIWSATLTNSSCASKTVTFTVPSSGSYFIGFHETSAANKLTLAVDDVNLSYQGPAPCISTACGSAAPVVVAQPTNQTVCVGSNVNFTAAASGVPAPAVQWEVSTDSGTTWNNVPGATLDTLTFTASAAENGYQYRAVYTSTSGIATSSAATLTVNGAPAVTTQPVSQTVCPGTIVSFTAAGSGTPAVQWQVSTDGGTTWSDVAGATSATLSFSAAASQNGYQYHAVFLGNCGMGVSNAATLSLNTAPAATTQPANQTVCSGSSVSFTAAGNGTPAPTIQWQVSTDGGTTWTNVGGATSGTLTFTAAASQNGYQYHAVFTNTCGTANSSAATVSVNLAPSVTTQPVSQTVAPGASVNFAAAASGTPAPTVQWQVSTNGGTTWSDIPGATSTTLTFTAQASENGYQYHAVFTNACGTATSNAAMLATQSIPSVTTQPTSLTTCSGSSASFTAAASGTPAPTVQWQVSTNGGSTWSDVPGAISTTLAFTAQASQTGYQYHAVFTNIAGTATSNAAALTVNTASAITTNPLSQTVVIGANATFTAAASGTPAPTLQWQVSTNGGSTWGDVPGAASTTLTFTAQASENGYQYRAVFTNTCGAATTNAATLAVVPALAVTAAGAPLSGQAPVLMTFTGLASGGDGGPYTYDWDFGDGSPHSMAQNPTHIYNVKGAFTVIFTTTDSSGHTASDSHLVANITVGAVPVVLNFYDDAGRARLCLNRLTGAYRWEILTGPGVGVYTGVATVVNGGAKAYSKPGDPNRLNNTYDAIRKRASGYFITPAGAYSRLTDSNTTNNPPGCY